MDKNTLVLLTVDLQAQKALKLMPYLEADINRFLENLSDDLDRNSQ